MPFSTMPEPEREEPPSPTPVRIYPSLPVLSSGTRQAPTSIPSSVGPPAPAPALLTSVDAALASRSVTGSECGSSSSVSDALGRLSLVSRLGRRLTGRQRQSTGSESTSATGSSNQTYSSASANLSSVTSERPTPPVVRVYTVRAGESCYYLTPSRRSRSLGRESSTSCKRSGPRH